MEAEIMHGVALYLRDRYRAQKVFLSDEYEHHLQIIPPGEKGPIPPALLESISTIIPAQSAKADEVLRCSGRTPDTCRLDLDADVLVYFSVAKVEGDSASVEIDERRMTGNARQPVSGKGTRLLLIKTADGWRVTGEREMWIT